MGFLLLGTFSAGWMPWVVGAVAILLVIRDVVDTGRQMQLTAELFPLQSA
jgi:hypothetical protein